MNERIKELAEQAGLLYPQFGPTVDTRHQRKKRENIEKFAELIVQECIDCVLGAVLADDVALRNNLGFSDGIAEGVTHIQKHFGVE